MKPTGKIYCVKTVAALCICSCALPAMAQSDAELAKKTQNPIAAMTSLPLQLNYDKNIGPVRDGNKTVLNVQPVIFTTSQLLKVRGQPLTLLAGVRYWADSDDRTGPKGWGLRLTVTFLFPK